MSTNQSTNLQNATVVKESFLKKKGHIVKNWKLRWFSLTSDFHLHYYKDYGASDPIDSIPIQSCTIQKIVRPDKPFCFELNSTIKGKSYLISCETQEDLNGWVNAIQNLGKSEVDDSSKKCVRLPDIHSSWEIDYSEIEWTDKRLGAGGQGNVQLASWRGADVAVKALVNSTDEAQFRNEVNFLSRVRHPNIVQLMGFCTHKGVQYLMTEYLKGGSLDQLMETEEGLRKLNLNLCLRICKDVCKGMICLHEQKIMHRDLKPANILIASTELNSPICAKVGDFGISKDEESSIQNTTATGTISYMAPEVYENGKYSSKVDVFSFGLIVWEMVSQRRAWSHLQHNFEIVKAVQTGNMPEFPLHFPDYLKTLVSDCWSINPDKRPPFSDCLRRLEKISEPAKFGSQSVGPINKKRISKKIPDKVNSTASMSITGMTKSSVRAISPRQSEVNFMSMNKSTEKENESTQINREDSENGIGQITLLNGVELEQKLTSFFMNDEPRTWEEFSRFLFSQLKAENVYSEPIRTYFFPDHLVRKDDWLKFLKWFGPLRVEESIYEDNSSIETPDHALYLSQVCEILRAEWFHGFIDSKEATERLHRCPSGAYLIRFSSELGNYVITINDNGVIRQWKISRNHNFSFTITPKNYTSLQMLIRTHQTDPLKVKDGTSAALLKRPCPSPPIISPTANHHYENVETG